MSDVSARRAAARKRILENSEERLKRITGASRRENGSSPTSIDAKVDDNCDKSSPVEETGSPANHVTSHSLEDIPYHGPEHSLRTSNTEDLNSGSSTETSSKLNLNVQQPSPSHAISTIISHRVHVIALAVLVRLLLSCNCGSLFGESIFAPLFTFKVIEYFSSSDVYQPEEGGEGGLLISALMLSGVTPHQITAMRKVFSMLKNCLDDIYLYFVSFVILHVLLGA